MEVRLVVCVANKLFPSTNQETAAHFISIPNPNKRFSPKFIPDQTFGCQRLHLPAAANYISCCPHSNKYVENYTRWERNADAFFYLIVPIPSNYWKNIDWYCYEYWHIHTHFFIFYFYHDVQNIQNISTCCSPLLSQTRQKSNVWSGVRRGKVCNARRDSGTIFLDMAIIWQNWGSYRSQPPSIDLILILMVGSMLLMCGPTDDSMPRKLHNSAVFRYMWQ